MRELIHPQTLQQLIDAVGIESTHEIADALKQTLIDFRDALPNMNAEEMGKRAHALKGSTSYLGTEALQQRAIAADTAHKDGDEALMREQLQALAALVDPSLAALDQALKDNSPP